MSRPSCNGTTIAGPPATPSIVPADPNPTSTPPASNRLRHSSASTMTEGDGRMYLIIGIPSNPNGEPSQYSAERAIRIRVADRAVDQLHDVLAILACVP